MSYQVLARKYRPQTFQDMMGQQHVLQALSNALEQNRLHHAYLFTGTRGVGKTTIGRILAKCLNCETGITATPCGQCQSCQSISAGHHIDLIEVDAASRTKVEDTRELLDNVQYAPTQGRFKIYLIDEVHMLSNHSFNALLKTLEEPPEHVKFLLATTDPDKLPVTILSRCLQFNLQNMLPDQIQAQLQKLLQAEAIEFESESLLPIALAAKGSMRDALSLLDQAIAYCAGHLKAELVQSMLGNISQNKMLELLTALSSQDAEQLLNISQALALQGVNFSAVTEDLINTLHDLALIQKVPDIELDHVNPGALRELAQRFQAEDIQLYYQIALMGRRDINISPDPKRGFQMLLLRLLTFSPFEQAQQRGTPTSQPLAQNSPPKRADVQTPKPPAATSQTQPPANPLPQDNQAWIQLIHASNLSGMCLTLASHCTLKRSQNQHIELHLDPNQAPLLNAKTQDRLQNSLSKTLGQSIKLTIECQAIEEPTPAIHTQNQAKARQTDAEQTLESDPNVQAIMEQFNAKLSKNSIKPTEA